MTNRRLVVSLLVCATLLAVSLVAQNPAPTSPGTLDITGIPAPMGVYYRSADGWMSLSSTVLMPFWDGRAAALEVLNVGSDHTLIHLPGSHAGTQIGNNARPVFYLHGVSPADLHLVHLTQKDGYREVQLPVSRHFWQWDHFRSQDLTGFEITGVDGDVVAIRPSADLKPGEYSLATVLGQDYERLRLGFQFGIVGVSARR
ncbi:MAG TPA: hypothetical protein VMB25_12515 [Bryobacteraceae bacterium]|nr:hypothetical protein [Bryobacteraceae bacterium]